MAYPRNGKTLLGGGGGEQRTGTAEEDTLQLSFVQLIQQIPTQSNGAAATAGTACMDILNGVVKYQCAAIRQPATKIQLVSFAQFQQDFLTDLSQIPCDDQVKILRLSAQIVHVGLYGLECSRGHCQV